MIDKKNNNNSLYGYTFKYAICCIYGLQIHQIAKEQFIENYDKTYFERDCKIIPKIFNNISATPIKLLTYTREYANGVIGYSPHDFMLDNGKTVSIKTNINGSRIAPRIVGQAGYKVINNIFGSYYGKEIETQEDIKKLFYNKIEYIFPIMLKYLFESDYLICVESGYESDYSIYERSKITDVIFDRQNFSFTKNLNEWKESNTIKYCGVVVAEVQMHLTRTFKFRFNLKNLSKFIV